MNNTSPKKGILKVSIIRGIDLVAKDKSGTSDPFLVLKLGKQEKKTKVISKTLNPVWNDVIELKVSNKFNESLELTCFDNDLIGKDFMGKIVLPLSRFNIEENHHLVEKFQTNEKNDRVSGELEFDVKFFPSYFIKIGGGEGLLNWHVYEGKTCNLRGNGWEAKFKICNGIIKGSNKNDDKMSVKKKYKGTYDPSTRQVKINVTYEDGQEGEYTGELAKSGSTTNLKLVITKKGTGAHVGDNATVSGHTTWE